MLGKGGKTRLVPLIAHDRAGLGGALAANGLGVLLAALWGYRPGARWLWWTLGVLVGLPLAALAALWLYTLTLRADVPDLYTLRNPDLSFSSVAYTADGVEIARYHAENRTWVGFDAISPHVVAALVATEDARFYDHGGVDLRRLASSAFKTLRGQTQGGSTITMQLARNLFPGVGREKTVDRKLREILTARRLEGLYSKEDILEMYLNTVPFMYNAFGVEAASARQYLADALEELGEHADQYSVPLIYEPLNRYETNQVNRVDDGLALLDGLSTGNVVLLCDLFHMNIEEADTPAAPSSWFAMRLAHRTGIKIRRYAFLAAEAGRSSVRTRTGREYLRNARCKSLLCSHRTAASTSPGSCSPCTRRGGSPRARASVAWLREHGGPSPPGPDARVPEVPRPI